MWSWILAVLKAVPALIGVVKSLLEAARRYFEERERKRLIEEIDKATDEARNAKTLDQKRTAACRIERHFNPDSDCAPEPGSGELSGEKPGKTEMGGGDVAPRA